MEGEEIFDSSFQQSADEVEVCFAAADVIMIKGTKNLSVVSLIHRGANNFMIHEIKKDLHDAMCIIQRTLESNTVFAGGRAVQADLTVYLENLGTTLGSREQLVIAEFDESFLTLAISIGLICSLCSDACCRMAMLLMMQLSWLLNYDHTTTLRKLKQIKNTHIDGGGGSSKFGL